MTALEHGQQARGHGFRHRALLYAGEAAFLESTLAFIRDGVDAGEPMLVMVDEVKITLLANALDGRADRVRFADMASLGSNPARLIPAWREFVDRHATNERGVRGVGEPVGPDRSPAELVECQRHESLLNLAFSASVPFELLCPYDLEALEPAVIDEARCSHPFLVDGAQEQESATYRGLDAIRAPFDAPLPEPSADVIELSFTGETLPALRALVRRQGRAAGLRIEAIDALLVGVNELATNSVRHGGGRGALRVWLEEDALICEISDRGVIESPLAGREAPADHQLQGRGLWLANQLCDLIQMRSSAEGTIARVHARR